MPRRERSRIRTHSNRRTRWTAEEAGRVLHALEESGLSQKEFCEREGLIPERLRGDRIHEGPRCWRKQASQPVSTTSWVFVLSDFVNNPG